MCIIAHRRILVLLISSYESVEWTAVPMFSRDIVLIETTRPCEARGANAPSNQRRLITVHTSNGIT